MNLYIDRSKSHETDLSTQQSEAEPQIRVPGPDENPGWKAGPQTPEGKGPDKTQYFGREKALLTVKQANFPLFGSDRKSI
jgi:hypothetical protein